MAKHPANGPRVPPRYIIQGVCIRMTIVFKRSCLPFAGLVFLAVRCAAGPILAAAPEKPSASTSAAPSTRSSAEKPPPLPANAAREQDLLAEAGPGFELRRTSHFVIAYEAQRETLTNLLSRLKATYYKVHRFCYVHEIPLDVKTGKLEVVFCDEWSSYVRQAQAAQMDPSGTYGFFDLARNRSYFCNVEHTPGVVRFKRQIGEAQSSLAQLERTLADVPQDADRIQLRYSDGRTLMVTLREAYDELDGNRRRLRDLEVELARYIEQLNQSVIQHEVAHHVLFAGGVHTAGASNPMWLVEGLAMQFETPPSRPRQTSTSINHDRLGEFRRAHEGGQLLPISRLISDPGLFSKNTPNRAIAYSQAWALVYYLSRNKSDRFAAYVRALAVRRPGVPVAPEHELSEFDRFFGPKDGGVISRWEKHILALPYRAGKIGR